MNDLARQVLVKAALDGVKQAKGVFRDNDGGLCAWGALFEGMSCSWLEMNGHWTASLPCDPMLHYDISQEESRDIVDANDKKGWDFLTIARKIGNKDGE